MGSSFSAFVNLFDLVKLPSEYYTNISEAYHANAENLYYNTELATFFVAIPGSITMMYMMYFVVFQLVW